MSEPSLFYKIVYPLIGKYPYYYLVVSKSRLLSGYYRYAPSFLKKRDRFPLNYSKRFFTPHCHTFFGYYDINPFSADETLLLVHRVPIKKSPKATPAELGYYFIQDDKKSFHPIDQSYAWCWQQGSRLQWCQSHIFYNQCQKGSLYGCFYDYKKKQLIEQTPLPIYDISPNEQEALSLNFIRLENCRSGYGYQQNFIKNYQELDDSKDGIWYWPLQKSSPTLLHTLKDLAQIDPQPTMKTAVHYVNHLKWSPDNHHFIFFHLWKRGHERYGRVFRSNRQGELKLLTNDRHISHFTWRNENEVLIYATFPQKEKTQFYLLNTFTGESESYAPKVLTEDGHPTFFDDHKTLLLDTYPNHYRYQTLYTYSPDEGKKILSTFYHGWSYVHEKRCDLHPRLSPSQNYICVDSVHFGQREIFLLQKGLV